ncbi:MAG: hypothetical protein JNK82_13550 [Myxococcaceae bacterium]|nr:hypothetical protein [Myxococcaceae bacterium]
MRTALLFAAVVALPAFAEAPLSLTASDGSGLNLVSLEGRAVVSGPLAFTELKLVFENPRDRVIEGTFHVVLPPLATVSRFAMKLDNRWQEGEVVEKQAARRAYEDFLHRRQDPALLEQSAGNAFDARVFPIPARGRKELILSYSHAPAATYVLPLKGLPAVATLDVQSFIDGKPGPSLQKKGWAPDADLVFDLPKSSSSALRAGDWVVAKVKPVAASQPDAIDAVTVLFDTSASRALGYGEQVALLQRLATGLGKARVVVAAFDQGLEKIYDGPGSGLGDDVVKKLKARKALGASDLEAALKWAGTTKTARVVVISDGVATAGADTGDLLIAAVKGLKAAGVQRLDTIALGGLRDVATLRQLVTAGLPRDGAVIDGDLGAPTALRRLNEKTFSKLAVAVDKARFVWPTSLDGVQAGDDVLLVAELPAGEKLKVTLDGKPFNLEVSGLTPEAPLLERAVAQAKIASLQERIDRVADGPKEKQALKDEAVKLSTKYRVLSAYTALLVLETEADYARFGIDRKALADILVVRDGRVAMQKRGPESFPPPPPPVVKKPSPPLESEKLKAKEDKKMAEEAKPAKASKRDEAKEDEEVAEAPKMELPAEPEPSTTPAPPPPPAPRPAQAPQGQPAPRAAAEAPAPARPMNPALNVERRDSNALPPELQQGTQPYDGPFKAVMELVTAKKVDDAVAKARGWREEQPGDVLALIALGEALEAKGDEPEAARAYGSVIDLFPGRADLRRFAGVRLERLKAREALALAADAYAKAAAQRGDHPASHRLLAFTWLKLGEPAKAFAAIEQGAGREYPSGRFLGVDRILREDAGLIGMALIKADPTKRGEVLERLKKLGAALEDKPSLRFVLNWETDANDVDFHIVDGKNGHAWYSQKQLASGGELYADVTTGYGPECFTIRNAPGARAYPYKLMAHYYSRGPMGYGMGKLEIIDHDGKGGLKFIERPYVVMVDRAYLDLGTVDAATLK